MVDTWGDTLFVDARYGDDTLAKPHRQDLPYATLTAAKNAALSGETIVVRPGTYNERNLLKTGVNWNFDFGAIVNYTGSANGSVFSDGVDGTAGAVACKILGKGDFRNGGSVVTGTVPHTVMCLSNASSNIYFEAWNVACTVDSDQTNEAIKVTLATLEFHCKTISSSKDYALNHVSGVTRAEGRMVSTLANSPAVNVAAAGLVFVGFSELIPEAGASASINAPGAVNIRTYGVVVTPTALDGDITETVGAITVDAQVD